MFRNELLTCMANAKTPNLAINIPTCDDMGDPARISVHSVWWGDMTELKVIYVTV